MISLSQISILITELFLKRFEVRNPRLDAAIAVTMIAVSFADAMTPLGVAVWIFYLAPVAIAIFSTKPRLPIFVAAVASVLLIIGFFFSPTSELAAWMPPLNRVFGFITIWVVASIVSQVVSTRMRLQREDWLRSGHVELADQLRGDLTVKEVSEKALRFIANRLDATVGALYVAVDPGRLTRLALHAYAPNAALPEVIRYGETLVGQCAAEQQLREYRQLPPNYLKVVSGTGEAQSPGAIIAPFVADGVTQAVIEVGFLHDYNAVESEYLSRVSETVGVALRSAHYRQNLQDLLEETQRQAEELKVQSEELEASNEELKEQTRQLNDAQIRLESQHAELEQSNQQLEEQTRDLEHQKDALDRANDEIKKRADQVEAASRYKSEFLANMSHELRTPLNSTLILAKLLSENETGNLSAEQVKFATTIYNSGNDLLVLINDILDLAKVEAGKLEIVAGPTQVSDVLSKLNETFGPQAQRKELALSFTTAPGAPMVIETDRLRLEQVLRNLLSNALKFTEKGSVSLSVERHVPTLTEGLSEDLEWVAFKVTDTGIGIPLEQQRVIFEAFRQADGTTNRKYGGTGLGLSISKDLTELLGGQIRVTSEAGKGSTFTFILPTVYSHRLAKSPGFKTYSHPSGAAAPDSPAEETTTSPASRPVTSPVPTGTRNFVRPPDARFALIVEDDPAFAEILKNLSADLGFGALVVESGEDALRVAEDLKPHAVILDLKLTDNIGLSVLDRLKSNPRTRHIPVHIISGHDLQQTALEMGAVGYVMKPAAADQIKQVFRKLEDKLQQQVKSVLIVEDNPIQGDSIQKLLSSTLAQTKIVRAGREAIEELEHEIYDCVVLDLSLPDMTGFEVLEKMTAAPILSFPPVIVYTGRELSREEEIRLRRYSQSVIIKGAASPERLLNEVTLFLHYVEDQLPKEKQNLLREYRSKERVFKDRKILLVDDDVRNIFALSAALEAKGAAVKVARNGFEAIQRLSEDHSIELVLMDIMMPGMDGFTAITEIRKDSRHKSLPIIAVTAKAMRDDYDKCLQVGASDYLSKPVDIEKLISLIRVWLPNKHRLGN